MPTNISRALKNRAGAGVGRRQRTGSTLPPSALAASLFLSASCLLFGIAVWAPSVFAQPSPSAAKTQGDWKGFRALLDGQRVDDAAQLLRGRIDSSDGEVKSLAQFALGVLDFQAGRDDRAQANLRAAAEGLPRLEDYARFTLGQSLARTQQRELAKIEFEKVLSSGWKGQVFIETRSQLAKLAIDQGNWSEAEGHLMYLQKRAKNSASYPSYLYDLLRVYAAKKKRLPACKVARQLYTKHPAAPEVASWDLDLHKALIDGSPLNCVATLADQKKRIRTLQYSGQSARAKAEIEILGTRAEGPFRFQYDMILANFLVEEGQVQEAFRLLIPYLEKQGGKKNGDVNFLMLLSKAASRAGEYKSAIGAYDRVYQLAGKGKAGRDALFMAAFLAYQTQDFDGATKRFQDLNDRFGRAGMARDSNWYLGWIHYLKGEYNDAYSRFAKVQLDSSSRRGRRRRARPPSGFSAERLAYWMAMSKFRAGEREAARKVFEQIARDKSMGYYSLAARARLEQLKIPVLEAAQIRTSASANETLGMSEVVAAPQNQLVSPFDLLKMSEISNVAQMNSAQKGSSINTEGVPDLTREEQVTAHDDKSGEAKPGEEGAEEADGESADAFAASGDEGEPAEQEAVEELAEGRDVEASPTTETVAGGGLWGDRVLSQFKGARVSDLMRRASDLVAIGFHDWARFELSEIETRTRDRETLRMLMFEHEENHSYGRSSYLAEINFGMQRVGQGLGAGRYLWEFAYPRAFEPSVVGAAKEFGIPGEMVWSIMRAESRYRPDVRSNVGALGLMQMMPYTGAYVAKILKVSPFHPNDLLLPQTNIRFGSRYLKRLSTQFSGKLALVAAAYNAGPHRVVGWVKSWGRLDADEFVEQIPYLQTRNYVKKVSHNYVIYNALTLNLTEPKNLGWLAAPISLNFEGPVPTKESWDDIGG